MKNDIKTTVASNLIALRKSKGLTQADVANALNYSDKSVSKWEHADSLPDISILSALADMYGVTLDYLTHEDAEEQLAYVNGKHKPDRERQLTIEILAVTIILLCSTVAFVYGFLAGVSVGNTGEFDSAAVLQSRMAQKHTGVDYIEIHIAVVVTTVYLSAIFRLQIMDDIYNRRADRGHIHSVWQPDKIQINSAGGIK